MWAPSSSGPGTCSGMLSAFASLGPYKGVFNEFWRIQGWQSVPIKYTYLAQALSSNIGYGVINCPRSKLPGDSRNHFRQSVVSLHHGT
ncbi:hypothetical protein GDO81_003343 [Engystomops pustulosus]|uniref:Uncharacterized protein n=1 Tax=Engystomops pustulosus TaxID=76066 RepID=A0AAV7A0J6_ENGPU|nr:hypothetical protein GDO81_003343 [Engystomops pustulosus]